MNSQYSQYVRSLTVLLYHFGDGWLQGDVLTTGCAHECSHRRFAHLPEYVVAHDSFAAHWYPNERVIVRVA